MKEVNKELSHGLTGQSRRIGLLKILLGYLLIAVLSMPYQSWRYASIHGISAFWSDGVGDSAFRASLWPIYSIYDDMPQRVSFSENELQSIAHFDRSIDASINAKRIMSQMIENDELGIAVTDSQKSAYRSLLSIAIDESDQVEAEALRKLHPELPEQFTEAYVPGITFAAFAFESHDHDSAIEAMQLWNAWLSWLEENKNEIRYPR